MNMTENALRERKNEKGQHILKNEEKGLKIRELKNIENWQRFSINAIEVFRKN